MEGKKEEEEDGGAGPGIYISLDPYARRPTRALLSQWKEVSGFRQNMTESDVAQSKLL